MAGVDTNGAVTDREEFAIGTENTATEVTAGEKEVVEENQVKDSIPADAAAPSINQYAHSWFLVIFSVIFC